MTDKEKLAEEYVKSVIDVNAFDWKVVREIALAHIAGQKAGGPKWHKVADGDLPKGNCENILLYNRDHFCVTHSYSLQFRVDTKSK